MEAASFFLRGEKPWRKKIQRTAGSVLKDSKNSSAPKKIPKNFGIKIDYRHLNLSKVAFSNISRSSGCAISMSAFALCFKLFPYKLVAPNSVTTQ
jgi:hypothetical protein